MKQFGAFFLPMLFMFLANAELIAQENAFESAKDYYFQLEDFVEPKIYVFSNAQYPELGQYWRISSIPDSNLLITEAFLLDFRQFESFKEQYDSTGSKVVEYITIESTDSIYSEVKEDEVFRWNSDEEYRYILREKRSGLYRGYQKMRKFQALNQMEILGEEVDVLRFKDTYIFQYGLIQTFRQQSFYSKEYGLVRYVRFNENTQESTTYILSEILTEEEWMQLQE